MATLRFGVQLATALFVVGLFCFSTASIAADLDSALAPLPGVTAPDETQLRDYVTRRAVLYEIRAMYDVVRADEIEYLLLADTLNFNGASLASAEAELDRDLLSEGSYFLVTLKYLISGGGAAWPNDRPAASYANDALIRIAALESQLGDIVGQGGDPLPIMVEANAILAQTEGETRLTDDINFFSKRDQIVDDVLKQMKDRA